MLKRLFERKPGGKAPLPDAPDTGVPDKLTPERIRQIVRTIIVARGYPADFAETAGRRVAFLEQRGLPGLGAFALEMINNAGETFEERCRAVRPDGREGGGCPFSAGIRIEMKLEKYLAMPPGQLLNIHAPSTPLLMVPKIADLAGPRGLILMVCYTGEDEDEPSTRTLVDGYRVAHLGPIDPAFRCRLVGVARFPEEYHRDDPPVLRAASLREIDCHPEVQVMLEHLLEKAS